MQIYQYKNYEEYLDIQNKTTKTKNNWIYARKEIIKQISEYKGLVVKNILCHGTRAAGEQKYFSELYPNAYIIGSEICDTAENFPMTVRWDFNKPKHEWIGKFDIVYTNSFDHCITPIETLKTWKSQLNKTGTFFLEYAERQSRCHPADPLDATDDEVRKMITDTGFILKTEITRGVKHGGRVFVCEVK